MSYPQSVEYQDAVQDPRNSFSDPELKVGTVAITPLGLPLALSGGFALTYTVHSGQKKFAVRCFHREVPAAQSRYARISAKLHSLASPYFVNFDFQPAGILVRGRRFPVVKMDWATGDTLSVHLDRSSSSSAFTALRQNFATLAAYLELNGVAHGDIQNENVIVAGNAIRLIDYDGMFVAGMPEGQGSEVGQKHFQHPERGVQHFGPKMDRFSFIVLDVSLAALAADPNLHGRFRQGGNAIIFTANDFAAPSASPIFQILEGMPSVNEGAARLAAICGSSIACVPSLSDFRAGRNIPTAAAPPIGKPQVIAAPSYIAAFPVLNGKDFNAVLRSVGDKVELVGEIVSVFAGTGKRGRGRGLPYVFINFGPWNTESVKVTIWSEGLGNLSTRPTAAWVGQWISVTGLIEPPYDGKHYGRAYRNVGITVTSDSQIVSLTEREALFRLGRGTAAPRTEGPKTNKRILEAIKGGHTPAPSGNQHGIRINRPSISPLGVPQPSGSRNQQILKGLSTSPGTRPQTTPPPQTPPSAGVFAKVPKWVWIVLGGIVFLWIMRRR